MFVVRTSADWVLWLRLWGLRFGNALFSVVMYVSNPQQPALQKLRVEGSDDSRAWNLGLGFLAQPVGFMLGT